MNERLHSAVNLLGFIMAALLFIALMSIKCDAAELLEGESSDVPPSDTITEYIDESVLSTEESTVVNEYVIEFPEFIGTYQMNEDDYNAPEVVPYAINNNVYAGSYNTTILSLWSGLIQNNVGKDYLAYRSSQYQYYIFFGEDFEYNGSRFSGSGSYYSLNTQNNGYNYTKGTDSFSVNVSDGYVYTNVTDDYPALDNDRGLLYEQIQTILLIALLSFSVLRWIFINR